MSKKKARFFSNLHVRDMFIDEINARAITIIALAPGSRTAECAVTEPGSPDEMQLFTYDELYNFKPVTEV